MSPSILFVISLRILFDIRSEAIIEYSDNWVAPIQICWWWGNGRRAYSSFIEVILENLHSICLKVITNVFTPKEVQVVLKNWTCTQKLHLVIEQRLFFTQMLIHERVCFQWVSIIWTFLSLTQWNIQTISLFGPYMAWNSIAIWQRSVKSTVPAYNLCTRCISIDWSISWMSKMIHKQGRRWGVLLVLRAHIRLNITFWSSAFWIRIQQGHVH